ncbi:hypothetical protein ES708_34705 [subsurface metagenome]
MLQSFFVHTGSIIAKCQHNELPRDKSGMITAIGLVKGGVGRFKGQPAPISHGVAGINCQICRYEQEVNVFADDPGKHLFYFFYQLVKLDNLGLDDLFARESEQLTGDVGGTSGCALNLLNLLYNGVIGGKV